MNDERKRILNLLASGKITADEAEQLLEAIGARADDKREEKPANVKYLRVQVDDPKNLYGSGRVNVRVPFNLLRAGMRLTALLPVVAQEPINKALRENGIDFDIGKIKPENLEELVEHLAELTVDVDGANGEKVRVYCE